MIPRFSPIWRTARSSFGSEAAPPGRPASAGETTSSNRFRTSLVNPTTEVNGVRSSWLTLARNVDFVALALSAAARAAIASSVASASWAVRVATRASSSRLASSIEAYRRAFATAAATSDPTVKRSGPIERSSSRPDRRLSTARSRPIGRS